MDDGLYNSGYERSDWYKLKEAVLKASNVNSKGKHEIFDELPEHLRASEIGDLVYQAVYLGHKKAAQKAAKLLTDNSNNEWLILQKS